MYDSARGIEGATELLVRKNRNGGIGYVDLYFYAQWMRFEDMLDPDRQEAAACAPPHTSPHCSAPRCWRRARPAASAPVKPARKRSLVSRISRRPRPRPRR